MFAVVANGIQKICTSQRALDLIMAIYPYPKIAKCRNEEEAREWLRRHSRSSSSRNIKKYGDTANRGYASVEYFIYDNNIYYNIDTTLLGYLKIENTADNVVIDARPNLIKVQITNLAVKDELIIGHVIAIRRILKIIGEFIDIDIVVPDMSIYLAATAYKGQNYMIKGLQKDIATRLGGVSFTVKEAFEE